MPLELEKPLTRFHSFSFNGIHLDTLHFHASVAVNYDTGISFHYTPIPKTWLSALISTELLKYYLAAIRDNVKGVITYK